MSRWTGNGVADGTDVRSDNVGATGNGDVAGVVAQKAGTPVFRYAGDGFETSGDGDDIARLDITVAPGRGIVDQWEFTAGDPPTGTNEILTSMRAGSSPAASLRLETTNQFAFAGATAAVPLNNVSRCPPLVVGHRYRRDLIVQQHPTSTRTTTNGRVVYRIVGLTDPAWADGGFYYDSGHTLNVGTADLTQTRVGKCGVGVLPTSIRFENIGWEPVTLPAATTDPTAVAAYFMDPPEGTPEEPVGTVSARPPAVNGEVSGDPWLIVGAATHGAALADEDDGTLVESPALTSTDQSFEVPVGQWAVPPDGGLKLRLSTNGGPGKVAGTIYLEQSGTVRKSWTYEVPSSVVPVLYQFPLSDTERTSLGSGANLSVRMTARRVLS